MPCLCSQDLAKLAGLALPSINVGLPKVALDLQAALNLAVPAPGAAQLALAMSAGLPSVSLSAAAKLSAAASLMAGIKASGIASANLSANLSMVVQSVNLNLGALMPLINIAGPSLSDLAKLAALMLGLQPLKINLQMPDAAVRIQAALNAMAGAGGPAFLASLGLGLGGAGMSLSASASASASLAASMNFGLKAMLNLALALGVNLNVANPLAALAAGLGPLLSLNIPPLTIPPLALGQLLSITAALGSIKMAMGINLALPNALGLLMALLPKLNLSLLANLSIPASLSASLSAQASAALSASLGPLDAALAGLNLNAMANANLALGLAVSLGQLGIKLALTPCLVCKVM